MAKSVKKSSGNECKVIEFIIKNKGSLLLDHVGLVNEIENPTSDGEFLLIDSVEDVETENAFKKADIFINKKGISIKQDGSSFSYNRIQRDNLEEIFKKLKFHNPSENIKKLDELILKFHNGHIKPRDRHWSEAFNKLDFRKLLEYLMMKGCLINGDSLYPAEFILTAPPKGINSENIVVMSFDEYFQANIERFYIALRRVWVGQKSKSEHRRALGIISKEANSPWCFETISGKPKQWRPEAEFPINQRRTVYVIFIVIKD